MQIQRVLKKTIPKVSSALKFIYIGGLSAGLAVDAYEPAGSLQNVVMPYAGSIVKATLQTTSARTAGTLTATPTKNSTPFADNGLTLELDAVNTTKHYCSVSAYSQNYRFAAGDLLGVNLSADVSWANSNGDLQVILYVQFDSV